MSFTAIKGHGKMPNPEVSILICSYKDSPFLENCLKSLKRTLTVPHEILVDLEDTRTGIENTPKRYQALFEMSKGEYVAKVDDDIWFWPEWYEEAKELVDTDKYSYVGIMNHFFLEKELHNYAQLPYYYYNKVKPRYTHIAGVCWLFKRELWVKCPYATINGTEFLDSTYGYWVYSIINKYPTNTDSILCNHMGVTRHRGVDKNE